MLKQKPSAEHSSSKLVVDTRCPAEPVPRDTDTNENEGFIDFILIDRENSKSPIYQRVLLLTRRINQLKQIGLSASQIRMAILLRLLMKSNTLQPL